MRQQAIVTNGICAVFMLSEFAVVLVVLTIAQAELQREIIPGVLAATQALRTNIYESGIMIVAVVVEVAATPAVVWAIVNVDPVILKFGVVVSHLTNCAVPRLWYQEIVKMYPKQASDSNSKYTHIQIALRLPSRTFRFLWLSLGVGIGFVISIFHLSGIALLGLLAALAGLSVNWSS